MQTQRAQSTAPETASAMKKNDHRTDETLKTGRTVFVLGALCVSMVRPRFLGL